MLKTLINLEISWTLIYALRSVLSVMAVTIIILIAGGVSKLKKRKKKDKHPDAGSESRDNT